MHDVVAETGLEALALARDHKSARVRFLALLEEGGSVKPRGGTTSVVLESRSMSSAARGGTGCLMGDAEMSTALQEAVGSLRASGGGSTEDMVEEAVVEVSRLGLDAEGGY